MLKHKKPWCYWPFLNDSAMPINHLGHVCEVFRGGLGFLYNFSSTGLLISPFFVVQGKDKHSWYPCKCGCHFVLSFAHNLRAILLVAIALLMSYLLCLCADLHECCFLYFTSPDHTLSCMSFSFFRIQIYFWLLWQIETLLIIWFCANLWFLGSLTALVNDTFLIFAGGEGEGARGGG